MFVCFLSDQMLGNCVCVSRCWVIVCRCFLSDQMQVESDYIFSCGNIDRYYFLCDIVSRFGLAVRR